MSVLYKYIIPYQPMEVSDFIVTMHIAVKSIKGSLKLIEEKYSLVGMKSISG